MMRLLLVIGILTSIPLTFAAHLDVDELLRKVKESQGIEGKINRQREARFLAEKSQQTQLLGDVKRTYARENTAGSELKQRFETNDEALRELETALKEKAGILGELFGVARQAAGDLRVELDSSLVSAQIPRRSKALTAMADSKELPTIDQLEKLWFLLQQEMTESGKIVKFPAQVMSAAGQSRDTEVVRVGLFNLIADGLYLRFIPETGRIVELARQPASRYLDLLEGLQASDSEQVKLALDPTRGAILGMLVQAPNFFERIDQGGVIGYIILALGLIGLIIVLVRLVVLTLTSQRIRSQLKDFSQPSQNNPLGRVLAAASASGWHNQETLELVIDEAVTRELPPLEWGQSLIKLLAAIAPLLGLLGTVTGMIATFQSISLFGTGDPKLMAAGISQALVTTMLGLVIAIPLLFLHSLMVARSRGMIQILDEQSAGLISEAREKSDQRHECNN